tara:strand:+ start:447 stop:578 length:132 start_codon:yes stop_codon:yes gene_type:complete
MIDIILNKIYIYDEKLTYKEKMYLKKYIEENEHSKIINRKENR